MTDAPPAPAAPTRGRRSGGKMARDGLLLLVILAMGLPFVVARIGAADLSSEQRESARLARRAAYEQQDWLANSMSNKVTAVQPGPDGSLRIEQRYYTFWGVPWGSSQVLVGADGSVTDVTTRLLVHELF
ncbi:MAG: hypothetical protein ACYC6T_10005 [Thermoleophilia bacterium]